MTDRKYIRAKFHNRLGVYPDLEHPKTFQEKLQWIKLNDRKSIYHQMVDKYDAKTFIINIIFGGIRYPLLVCLIHLTKWISRHCLKGSLLKQLLGAETTIYARTSQGSILTLAVGER